MLNDCVMPETWNWMSGPVTPLIAADVGRGRTTLLIGLVNSNEGETASKFAARFELKSDEVRPGRPVGGWKKAGL